MPDAAPPYLVIDARAADFDERRLTNVPQFKLETFSGCLLCFWPGQALPRHRHAHAPEVFDGVAGSGTVWLNGQALAAGPGLSIGVPAGVEHGFENTGSERWLVRATIHQRTNLRAALKLAMLKRLGRARW